MADLRFDPLNDNWVAIARNRMQRPTEYIPIEQVQKQLLCPFCVGNEEETPGHFSVYDSAGQIKPEIEFWSTRVVPNKFPSFSEAEPTTQDSGPYQATSDSGVQEIVIPSPRHIDSFSHLTDTELYVAMKACQDRWKVANDKERIEHVMLFLNCRSAAGASLMHIHLQLIGTPLISPFLKKRQQRNVQAFEESGDTLVSRLIRWEREQAVRIIFETSRFVVFCPYASRFPVQVNIVPKSKLARFADLDEESRMELGLQIRWIVKCLEEILEKPAYNILFHTPPDSGNDQIDATSWYVEIFPRMTTAAGFEWGTNTWVNPVAPEAAAKRLKAFQNESTR